MDKGPIAGIILAAGMSKRFGKTKQLFKLGSLTILSMVITAAVKSGLDGIILVLGHKSEEIKLSLKASLGEEPRLVIIDNPDYAEGMSTSLKRGVIEIKERFSSAMILMGDQPFLGHEIIDQILDAFKSSPKNICVPICNGKRGMPVCFSDRFYQDILNITGDTGAREIIRDNPSEIQTIEIDDPVCFLDIDEDTDLARLEFLLKRTIK